MKNHAKADIKNMDWKIKKGNTGHKETSINRLRCIYGVEEKPDFATDGSVMPVNRAAK